MKKSTFAVFALALGIGAEMFGASELLPAEIGLGWKDGWVKEWRRDVPDLEVRDSRVEVKPGLVRVVRRWTWKGRQPLEQVTLAVRCHVDGDTATLKPFIPGVLMYGNPSNKGRKDGRVPVYAGEPGEFAIFEDHRLPMPFAILEDAKSRAFTAVHTLPSPVWGATHADQWWSIGVEAAEKGADLVLLSGPVGYNRRRSVVKARQGSPLAYDTAYITLSPGQVVEKTFWLQTGTATDDAFGFQQAMVVDLDLFQPFDSSRYTSFEQIIRTKRDYALTRWMDDPKRNACGFSMYELNYNRELTMGWCGCSATCGYALPVLDLDAGDWNKAQRSLDCLADKFSNQFIPHGLFRVIYNLNHDRFGGGDPVSCGQGLNSIMKAIRFAAKHPDKLNPAKWRAFAQKAADAMSADILRPDWREPRSTNVGFEVAPLVAAHEVFGKAEYLAAAEKLAAVFERKYFGYDAVYWGGTLDASCEDKEGAFAAFQGYVALLRHALAAKDAAAEKRYCRLARHAMDMMLTYTMVWDATYPPGRLSDHAFKSTGWTVVSAQNQHLDAFGVLTTPDIWWMGAYLGDERLKKLACVMYRSCFQLTDDSGSLGEQIQHTNYAQHGEMNDVRKLRGGYSERWTVFWLTAHFLNAGAAFKEMGVTP